MRKLIGALALFSLCALAVGAVARAQDVERTAEKNNHDYAVDVEGNLYEIECDKLTFRKVGRVQAGEDRPVLTDLAATPDGYLYGISGDALYLIRIEDPTKSIKLGEHGLTGPYGMGTGPNGELVVNTRDGQVCTLDKKNGKPTMIGPMGGGFVASGDVALVGEKVVSSVKDDEGHENLVTIDMKTGKATLVARFIDQNGAEVANVFGLIYRKDVLYGLTADGDIVRIDPLTAKCVRLLSTGIRWWGATDYQRI